MEIRSYRRVFDLERRIYRVDRLRLNPGGVPVRGVAYLTALLAAVLTLARLPLLGEALRVFPWFLRDVGFPCAAAALLTVMRVDGRPFHLMALTLARYWTSPRRLSGLSRPADLGALWRPDDLIALPDGSDGRMRRLRFTGPGTATVTVRHDRRGASEHGSVGTVRWPKRRVVSIRESASATPLRHAEMIQLRSGAVLHVHPSTWSR